MMPLMTSRLQNKILNYCINFCTNSFPMTVGTWVCTSTMDEGGEVWMPYWPKWAFGWVLNAKVQKYKLYLESFTLGLETFSEGTFLTFQSVALKKTWFAATWLRVYHLFTMQRKCTTLHLICFRKELFIIKFQVIMLQAKFLKSSPWFELSATL